MLALAACTSDDGPPKVSPEGAYTAVVQWVVSDELPAQIDDTPPIIYIATDDGSAIAAGTQATVARDTVDDATVRFADDRDDALHLDTDLQPVRDDGVLITLTPIDAADHFSVEHMTLTLYSDAEHTTSWELTLSATSSG
ncbi:unnamed protein product, partial [Phaeothamnion confervicola]